jgi:hypothetical protein
MSERATEGAVLGDFLALAISLARVAERKYPRRGPGRKPEIPDWMMAVFIVVAIVNQKKSKSAQYRFLFNQRSELKRRGLDRFPSRSTYFDRYRRAWRLLEEMVCVHGEMAVLRGWVDARDVAGDKSLVAARGPVWHQRQKTAGQRPRGVDTEATWGRSDYDGWVYGYSYEVLIPTGKNQALWPLSASFDTGSCRESVSFRKKIPHLPSTTKTVACDKAYDSDELGEAIEWTPAGCRTGRRFLCPAIVRHNARKIPRKRWRRTVHRQLRKQRRQQREQFLQSAEGRRLYARRGCTIEPFNSWMKELFGLEDRVWHRGLDNNRTMFLAAICAYQLILRINQRRNQPNGQVKWFIDRL